MKNKLQILLLCLLTVAGCKDDSNGPTTPSGLIYTYYPNNVGHELIYDVVLITKDEFTGIEDTSIYQLKEVVESIITDNQGRPTERLERYTRNTPNDPWVIGQVWTSNLTTTHLERKEDNIIYSKLSFPISLGKLWNGNVYNTNDPMDYKYLSVHNPMTFGTMTFDSTLTVLQEDNDNAIETLYQEEVYANHVGIVYKQQIEKKYTIPNQPGIKAQRLYTQTINSYSN